MDTITVNAASIPAATIHGLALATRELALKVQRENPELWARIKARGKEIEEGGGGKYDRRK